MIQWDEALVKELAARRCIIFMGAGASAGCVPEVGDQRPPNWDQLLKSLRAKIAAGHENLPIIDSLLSEYRYLDAAEVIVSSISHAVYVAAMRSIFESPRYKPSPIHEAVLGIDPKVVITTNFDTVYDHYSRNGKAAEGYNVFKYHEDHLVSDLRTPIRCVVKAHGCITNPDKMVLTKAGFFSAKQNSPHFFKVLDALFLTNTIFFVGYSLADPDIQLTLENANIAAPSSHKHYFVTEAGTSPALRAAAEKAYNVQFIEFPAGDYNCLNASMSELSSLVQGFRQDNPGT